MIGEEAVQACGLLDLHTCHAVRNALQSFEVLSAQLLSVHATIQADTESL